MWSGMWNLIGVLLSSGAVAFAVVSLLPVELILKVGSGAGFAMVFALLVSAILWNLSTWWYGLPASSSHTLIGSIIGVGVANQLMAGSTGTTGVDWAQVGNVFRALLVSPVVGFVFAALLLLLFKVVIKDPRLFEAPKGDAPPPFWIRGLLVLTCTGVSFAHGSNDGQKGMGLIMLILIGTVPTAYALNHAVGYCQVQDFVAVSEQAAKVMSAHVDANAVMDDPRADLTEYLQTKKQTPTTILAERQMILEIEHEVAYYKTLKGVPAKQQSNVRNDMYISSEALRLMAKSKNAGLHRGRSGGDGELQEEARPRNQVHPHLGQGFGCDRARAGHDGWLEADCRHRRREDRENSPDLRPRRFGRTGRHVHDSRRGYVWTAGQYHARALFRGRRHHDGEQERAPVVDHPQHRGGLGLHLAGGGSYVSRPVLGLCTVCAQGLSRLRPGRFQNEFVIPSSGLACGKLREKGRCSLRVPHSSLLLA